MCILVLHEEVKSIMRLSTQASDMVRTQNTSINMQAETKALKKKETAWQLRGLALLWLSALH